MTNSIAFSTPNWEGTNDRLGFGGGLPSLERTRELQLEFAAIAGSWSKRQILTVMGVLNAYIYRAAIDTRSLTKEGKLHRITKRLIAIAQQGIELFNLTQQGICTYLKEHWQGANCGKTTIWKIRDLLADVFGLFSYQKQKFQAGEKKRGTAPDIENFDLIKALILYEYLEELYCGWHYQELEGLPKHRGAIVRLVYNAVFKGIKRFRRKLPEGVTGYDLYRCEIYRKDYRPEPVEHTPTLIPDQNGVFPERIVEQPYQNLKEPCLRRNTHEWHGITLEADFCDRVDNQ